MPTDIELSSLIINEIESVEVYRYMEKNGLLQPNQLYLVPDAGQVGEDRFLVNVPLNWTEDEETGAYYQELEVEGMNENYEPVCDYLPSDDLEVTAAAKEAWGCVTMVDTFNGKVKLWASSAPTTEFVLRMNVFGYYGNNLDSHPNAEGVEF